MQIILLSLAASVAALLGGLVAFKGRSKLNLALGFTAGIILGLVAFDLLPEIFEIAGTHGLDPMWPMIALVVGFIGHRFADGFNTTNVMLHHKNKPRDALKMLIIAAIMPILGGISTLFFTLPEVVLAIYLGFFAGFLLYIGASDILPQAHSKGSSWKTICLTIFGTFFIFVITRFAA
ncbi:hypothetical protein HY004_00415 [Candidatus Saccharibacteria bacterium]|nr:hypothetical protein [Candidatus Saccharibacteria bacterium]